MRTFVIFVLFGVWSYLARAQAATGRLVVHVDKPGVAISPSLYGLMTEEINHAYDGGLYAELVSNRTFEDDSVPSHWSVVRSAGAEGTIVIDTVRPVNAVLRRSLRLDIARASRGQRFAVANDGYWGIAVSGGATYRASFYARASDGYRGPIAIDLESADGRTILASATVSRLGAQWKKYGVILTVRQPVDTTIGNRIVISGEAPGSIWLSLVSLFPRTYHDRPNGNRVDLMERLAALHPAFLRFPGGNYLEGDSIATRFDWKKTIGPIEGRPGHRGPWGYRSSDGLGLLEFLEWCEDLGMEPVLAVYDGYSLKGEHAAAGPRLAPYVQDALDEIEYATGDARTTWGARRAADGHPAAFRIRYVEIGNEEDGARYEERFAQFYDTIKATHPEIQVIATSGVRSRVPDVIDEHYYESPAGMRELAHHYDGYLRTGPKIFVGEWATVKGSPTPTLEAALADAAWMTGLERNADLVIMSCYAPLLVNVNPGAFQWRTNLIGYDAARSFGSTSYFVQRMFMTHRGDRVLPVESGDSSVFVVASRDTSAGRVILKVVNAGAEGRAVTIELAGAKAVELRADLETLSGNASDVNSLKAPEVVAPVRSAIANAAERFAYTFPARSVTVMVLMVR